MQALSSVPGWKVISSNPLSDEVTASLRLDDYINATYSDGQSAVSLYIGYYYSNKKIGAAHDPMVCFPGQGWMVSVNRKGEIKVDTSAVPYVKYSSMVVSKGDQKDLILYWYQSYDVTSANTFAQKVQAFLNNFSQNAQGNAFVRVTVSLKNTSLEHARKISEKFIKAFYPVFLTYIYHG